MSETTEGARVETGLLIEPTTPKPHYCRPPAIFTWDTSPDPAAEFPRLDKVLRAGTVFVCDCGQSQVVWDRPSQPGRINGLEWRVETRRERKKREKAK